jgi:hypothetical protein
MFIYVKCITYGYFGKNHLFSVKATDTLLSLKEKIMKHFGVGENIHIFDDKTEHLLTSYEDSLQDCFSPDVFYSVTFGEYKQDEDEYYI